MLNLKIADILQGKPEAEIARAPGWPALAKLHLEKEPVCQVCGRDTRLNVHHIRPVHLFPDLELEPSNLITLCNHWVKVKYGIKSCHLHYGHWGYWRDFNADVVQMAKAFRNARLFRRGE